LPRIDGSLVADSNHTHREPVACFTSVAAHRSVHETAGSEVTKLFEVLRKKLEGG
jgi:hypothetical protein